MAWEERKCVAIGFPCRNLVWSQRLGPLLRQSFSSRDRELAWARIFLSQLIVLGRDSVWAKSKGLQLRQGSSMSRLGWSVERGVSVTKEGFRSRQSRAQQVPRAHNSAHDKRVVCAAARTTDVRVRAIDFSETPVATEDSLLQ